MVLLTINNIPAGVCISCGESFISDKTMKVIEKLLRISWPGLVGSPPIVNSP
ncbi:MAG: YgiT-type zinc finger protein [Bacillota bacterium]